MTSTKGTGEYHGIFGLDRLSPFIKVLIWLSAFILVLQIMDDVYSVLVNSVWIVRDRFPWMTWLGLGSPLLFFTGIIRLAGIKWKYAILLFIAAPMALTIQHLIAAILWGLMGD